MLGIIILSWFSSRDVNNAEGAGLEVCARVYPVDNVNFAGRGDNMI